MEIAELVHHLDHPEESAWLRDWGIQEVDRAHQNLVRIASTSITLDLLADICGQLAQHLPQSSDPDRALNNLERFIAAARNPLSIGSLFERDREALPILVRIFSASQYFSDLLVADSGAFELLRITQGQPVNREALVQELITEVMALSDTRAVTSTLRRFKRRETLRIGYGDIIREQPLETVTSQISYLADAVVEGALRAAQFTLEQKYGTPRTAEGEPAQFVVLALGKLGGVELNYSSDIDLIFLYDEDGNCDGKRKLTNQEFFSKLARELVKLLTDTTDLGQAYRVDLRLRPGGGQGQIVISNEGALSYYDIFGRTWERQAFVKARPIAGDIEFGERFLKELEPWIYRRYLSLADITGIKALKRRIEQRALREDEDKRNVKTGHGGIRDIEFVIQFLQLLNGGDLPEVREGNTLRAMAQLAQTGCLTEQERSILDQNYRFLRKVEHRLQFMFDLQTHLLPEEADEMQRVAMRMGYRNENSQSAREAFEKDLQTKNELNRKILDHLLHDAFPDDPEFEPEVDLVLDPDPAEEKIHEVLGKYPFRDIDEAYKHLMGLATEQVRWLSPRRCRLFLASIAPRLLKEIAATPDPDQTLVDLEKVSESLGGKAVLWELFRFNHATLNLYVDLCANSPFLTQILVSNPGMVDELMDSLVYNKLPSIDELREELNDLCLAAEDLEPILHAFKNSKLLRVGVRDILAKEQIEAITGALSDLAQVCLEQIVEEEYERLIRKFGEPLIQDGSRQGERAEIAIVAMGKFGGRELSYHSDLDVIFLYEADGMTEHERRSRKTQTTTNQHFFSELGSRIITNASRLGQYGRLYEIDPRLRPTGRSGSLATDLNEFERYFAEGEGTLWERQALCKARIVYGSPRMSELARRWIERAAYEHDWNAEDAESIRHMRHRLQETASKPNLKRGSGGIVDIEFLAQMLQLQHGREDASLREPSTLAALAALREAGHLSEEDHELFSTSYRFLRKVEARLRLMNPNARDDLPEDPVELRKLAVGVGYSSGDELLSACNEVTSQTRQRFDEIFDAAAAARR